MDLVAHYAEFYGSEELRQWRRLGARQKADNLTQICGQIVEQPAVIEIGCGDGALLAELEGFARRIAGYDVSPSGIAEAKRLLPDAQLGVCDGAALPEKDSSFDLAVLSHVLEHVDDPRSLLREAARVAPLVYVEVPLELHARTPHDFRWTRMGHINLFNRTVLRHLVESVGLAIVRERVTGNERAIELFFRPGLRGTARWAIKATALRASVRLATGVFTYNGAVLASRPQI
jgi:SAM-dependent methyltransferase